MADCLQARISAEGLVMRTVAITGAGFSGTAMAINLLRQGNRDVRGILINRSGGMARGLAYGTSSSQHLLNVPALGSGCSWPARRV